ncbi:MAG: aspartate/glutamate racemase family protein [Lachnospiraceae bacterium]|nr:aspartate/glutamate racemase family protein [Lachnospiraceae bacterium]
MKIGIVHTSVTEDEEFELEEIVQRVFGEEVEFYVQSNPYIIKSVDSIENISPLVVADIVKMYMNAVCERCDIILSACVIASIVCDRVQELSRMIKIPIISIESGMCNEAVKIGKRIGILGTISTSVESVKKKIETLQKNSNHNGEIITYLVEPNIGTDKKVLDERVFHAAKAIANRVDVILLAQGSIAHTADDISKGTGKPVLGSVYYAAKNLKEMAAMYDVKNINQI